MDDKERQERDKKNQQFLWSLDYKNGKTLILTYRMPNFRMQK